MLTFPSVIPALSSVIPAQAGTLAPHRHSCAGRNPRPTPSFLRRQEPAHHPRHSCAGRNPRPPPSFLRRQEPAPPTVIPAQAGTRAPHRHSCAGRNPRPPPSFLRRQEPAPYPVIPAQAGTRAPPRHSCAGRNPRPPPSFLRRQEPRAPPRHSCAGRNPRPPPSFLRRQEPTPYPVIPALSSVIPAQAGTHAPPPTHPPSPIHPSPLPGGRLGGGWDPPRTSTAPVRLPAPSSPLPRCGAT